MMCTECNMPMVARQYGGRHYSCCSAMGGRDPICNPSAKPVADDDGRYFKRCVVVGCWRRGDMVATPKKRKRAA